MSTKPSDWNPRMQEQIRKQLAPQYVCACCGEPKQTEWCCECGQSTVPRHLDKPTILQPAKPLLNKLETRYRDLMLSRGITGIMEQAITLRLDPPFKSYKPDLAFIGLLGLMTVVEVKGPHRFREKGIAKAALAAKTYPKINFILAEWKGKEWKETILSP